MLVGLALCATSGFALPANSQSAPTSRSFGDTTEFGVRVISIHPDSQTATISATRGKNLILVEVVPGQSIDILYPGGTAPKKTKIENTFSVSLARYVVVVDHAATEAAQRQADEATRRCEAAADAAARRAAAATRTRDASGKETGPTQSQVMTTTADASKSGSRCGTGHAPETTPRRVLLPPRSPADRYLVVLSTSEKISPVDLTARLATLSTVGTDVSTVIEATASGLLIGFTNKWGGAFIPW